ncbi:outer membrane immunogenic protein [Methylosinus sp. sav-2]|uniref:outer membrane protein n=1 Tax=Methylosinus sp. sav-2 TaxID=2485168 RepID=UPI000479998A|nr:outer membrane protein [Methylosinus sp. sav-2]TDX67061.1 outer membrane immunogenic protein [Methylosinus sp. sav-2]
MKPVITALVLAAAFSAGAQAADLPSRERVFQPPPTPPAFAWTGVYAGLDIGAGAFASGKSDAGVSGGGLVGYNHRIGPLFVVGLETDFSGTSLSGGGRGPDPLGLRGPEGARSLPWFGTLRGRFGVTGFDSRVLFYGTGGFAYGDVGGSVREGWTAGGGVEWAFAPRWSVKTEYLFTDLGENGGGDPGAARGANFHTVRVGVNYHFDLPSR